MSLIAKESIRYEEIARTIQAAGGHSLKQITLIDLYRGKQIPSGRMSVTVSAGDRGAALNLDRVPGSVRIRPCR